MKENLVKSTRVEDDEPPSQNKIIKEKLNRTNPNLSHEVILTQTIYQLKIILVGDSGVGKTSLVNRYMGYDFQQNLKSTVNVDFKIKSISVSTEVGAELTIWDTCGQERFRSMTRNYFADAQGIVLVYDVGEMNSFDNLDVWLEAIKDNSKKDPAIILVANKIDLEERKVTKEKGTKFAEKHGIMYAETSSKEGINIDSPFEKLTNTLINKIKENPNDNINTVDTKLKDYGQRETFEKNREKEVKCC
jgi:small GTP-binding protein